MRNRVSSRNSPKIWAEKIRNPVSWLGDRILGYEKPGFFSESAKNLGNKHEKPGFLFGYESLEARSHLGA